MTRFAWALVVAGLLAGCNNADIDTKPAGSGLHTAEVMVNAFPPLARDEILATADKRAMDLAVAKCGAMRVAIVREYRETMNTLRLEFRCEP